LEQSDQNLPDDPSADRSEVQATGGQLGFF
jgi:hypothetical protein